MATSIDLTGGNLNKPAPKWFIKTKNAVSILADAACVILITTGKATDNAFIILILRVGLSALFNAVNGILADA